MKSQSLSFRIIVFLGLFGIFSNCDLTKDVELELPSYENLLVLECYLEVGKPFQALLTESVGYFSAPSIPAISDALVVVDYNGIADTLENAIVTDPENNRIVYNYSSLNIVPEDYDAEFKISVKARDGRSVSATTKLLQIIPIDTLEVEFRQEDSLALVITRVEDPIGVDNYYRRMLHVGEDFIKGDLRQDFSVDDRIVGNTGKLFFGTGYNFEKGDTIISSIYHIDKAYYDFLETIEDAVSNNGNPFGQPGRIISNVEGGTGIFTGLSIDRKKIIIE